MVCFTADSATKALSLAADGLVYDLAIIDMSMPDGDGVRLSHQLASLPHPSAAAPHILLTSTGTNVLGDDPAFAAVLSRPVKSTRLRDTLTEVVLRSAQILGEGEPRAMREKKILLAEDNVVTRRVMQLMLGNLGYHVDIAQDGAAAVQAVKRAQYDVVLMDVQMPVMDGLEATRRIRTVIPQGRQPHIVALTASALVEDRQACTDAGMEAYLTKPVRAAELSAVLEQSSLVGSPQEG
jgi:CheY-like chemotaxis protein